MRVRDISIPVVILKMEHYGALGIVRSLGQLGISVCGVDRERFAPGFASKYCRRKFVWDIDGKPEAESVGFLLDAVGKIGHRAILLPTSDETAQFVVRNSDRLRKKFLFPVQPADLVERLCSKKEMYYTARRHNIPTPLSVFPRTRDEVEEMLGRGEVSFPLILKGIDGKKMEERFGKKMVVIHTAEELLQTYETIQDHRDSNTVLQEYIPGEDSSVWMFNGYFNERSECLAAFTGRKIHQNPVYTGMTALGLCEWNESVARTTTRFMKEIGYRGIVDVDYRYDARDGQYKILDVNPRVGASFRLFVARNGMDVVRALYLDLTRQAVLPVSQQEGRKWIVEDKDLVSGYRYIRDGKMNIVQWIQSLRGVAETGYFDKHDILPFVAMIAGHIQRTVQRLFGRRSRSVRQVNPPAGRTPSLPSRDTVRENVPRLFEDDSL
ncbi:MAG TPA: ATP-grasp domain-containing protein [Bacteroidota bacterium]